MTLGEKIKKRREELGLSVDDVAKKLGKHRSTIYRYESEEISKFPTEALEPLAVVLQTTPGDLMRWGDTPANPQDTPAADTPPQDVTEELDRQFTELWESLDERGKMALAGILEIAARKSRVRVGGP